MQACLKAEHDQTKQHASVEAHSKPHVSEYKPATPRVYSCSVTRSCFGQSRQQPWMLSSESEIASDDSKESTSHAVCWLIPVTMEAVNTSPLINQH